MSSAPRMPRLQVAARDAWLLAAQAIEADLVEMAGTHADEAVRISGWGRYPMAMDQSGTRLAVCPYVPRGWGYLGRLAWHRLLLVHPQTAPFVMDTMGRDFDTLMVAIHEQLDGGTGMVQLEVMLGEFLANAFDIPEDPSALFED